MAGQAQEITAIVPDLYYSHSPVVWTSLSNWADITHAPADVRGTVLLTDADDPDAVSSKKLSQDLPLIPRNKAPC